MTEPQRAAALRACAALYGFAVAISLHDRFLQPAPPTQLPGLMKHLGYDAHASFRFAATLVVLPLVFAFAARGLAAALAAARTWAQVTFAAACIAALWMVSLVRDPLWVALPPLFAIAVAFALRQRDVHFTRRDVVLIPTFAAVWLALVDATQIPFERTVLFAAAIVFALRLVLPVYTFTLAPLALVAQTHFLGRNERYLGWPALAIVVLTPLALRFGAKDTQRMRRWLAWVIYPVACIAYLSATSLFTAEGKPRVNLFEDAQHLVPSSEMARGEKLYRDIIPPHGLIQDALLDRPFITPHGGNVAEVQKGRGTISALIACAQYTLGVAGTGSAEGGVLAFFLGAALGIGGGTFRAVPALFALAITLHAVRKRRARLLGYAGAGVVVAFLTSLDFGFYSGMALLVACLRFRGARLRALGNATLGGTIAVVVTAIALAINGILVDFVRTTFFDIATWGPAYALTPFDFPPALKANHLIPDVLAVILDRGSYLYLLWAGVLLFFAAAVTSRRTNRRVDVMTVFAAFTIVCAVSYAERHHLHFQYGVPSLFAGTLYAIRRTRLFPAAVALVLVLAQPTIHLAIVAGLRHANGPIDSSVRELTDPPRARGALFLNDDATLITTAQKYLSTHLNPEETFLDFTNRGILYYLTDRDCPLRQLEVAFYEPEQRQREVIAAIERNPRIRCALVPPAEGDDTGVDGISNPTRAPLVWQYIQEHFEPDFQEGKVVFWRRK